jgi:hypothetical protein
MQFFLPFAESPKQAEDTLTAITSFVESQTSGVDPSRGIFRLKFRHNGVDEEAEVGKTFEVTGEPVVAILKGITYLVCTPNRGVLRGFPILVGEKEVRQVEDFETASA